MSGLQFAVSAYAVRDSGAVHQRVALVGDRDNGTVATFILPPDDAEILGLQLVLAAHAARAAADEIA